MRFYQVIQRYYDNGKVEAHIRGIEADKNRNRYIRAAQTMTYGSTFSRTMTKRPDFSTRH